MLFRPDGYDNAVAGATDTGSAKRTGSAVKAAVAALLLVVLSLALVQRAGAATLTVCPAGPPACDYPTIQAAIAAAAPNDTITVANGTYAETGILINKPLTIIGESQAGVIVTGGNQVGYPYWVFRIEPPATVPAGVTAGDITISNLSIVELPRTAPSDPIGVGILMKENAATTPVPRIVISSVSIDGGDPGGDDTRTFGIWGSIANPTAGVQKTPPELVMDDIHITNHTRNGVLLEDWGAPVTLTNSTFDRALDPNHSRSDFIEFNYHAKTVMPNNHPRVVRNNSFEGSGVWWGICSYNSTELNVNGYTNILVEDNIFSGVIKGDTGINVGGNACSSTGMTSPGADLADATFGTVIIQRNTVEGDGTSTETNGIRVTGPTTSVTVLDNSVTGMENGIYLRTDTGLGSPSGVVAQQNRLIANSIGLLNESNYPVDATKNWWGCQDGPESGSRWCSPVVNTGSDPMVDVSTWLLTTRTFALNNDLTGDGTATLRLLNTGTELDLPAIFDGLASTWLNAPGTVTPTTGTLDFGLAEDTAVTVPDAQSCGIYWTVLDQVVLADDQIVMPPGNTVTGEPIPTFWCVLATGTDANFVQTIDPGLPATSFAVVDGALPDGLTLDPVSGHISGIPADAGVFPFSVEITYPDGTSKVLDFVYVVTAPPVITSDAPGDGSVGETYEHLVTATGAPTITYSIVDGALPDGLSLDPATGKISGTPTEVGTFTFSVQAANEYGTDVAEYSVTIDDLPVITSGLPLDGDVGASYSHQVTADGAGPITYSIVAGSLPPGLTLNATTGVISGTPTTDGAFSFTVQAANASGTDTAAYTIVIGDEPAIISGSPPAGVGGEPYSFTIQAGGADPMTYSVVSGVLPDGLTLNPATGVLSGTATRPGTYTFTVRAENEYGYDDQTYTLVIAEDASATTSTTSTTASSTTATTGGNGGGVPTTTPTGMSGGPGSLYRAPTVSANAQPGAAVPTIAEPVASPTPQTTAAQVRSGTTTRQVAFTGTTSAPLLLTAGCMLLLGAFAITASVKKRRN